MKPHRTKFAEVVRQLEITHGTQHFPRALSNVLMELADKLSQPVVAVVQAKTAFKKFRKPKNYEAVWRDTRRIEQFHDDIYARCQLN